MVISKEDQERVSQAVARAEKNTSGEIVPMIVSQSDSYPAISWRLGSLFGFLGTILFYLVQPDLDPIYYLLMLFILMLLGRQLHRVAFLTRWLMTEEEAQHETYQRALQEFFSHKITDTEKHTGILIFVSWLEHRVIILADEGINSKVKPGIWNEIVRDFVAALKKDRFADGFCQAIERCGTILAEHLPAATENKNEIPNHLVIKD